MLDTSSLPDENEMHSILAAQDIHIEPPSGIHDFAELTGPKPTDIDISRVREEVLSVTPAPKIEREGKEVLFTTPKEMDQYLAVLMRENPKLKVISWDLKYVKSNNDIRDIIEKNKTILSGVEYATMLRFLPAESHTTDEGSEAPQENTQVVESDVPAGESPRVRARQLASKHGIMIEGSWGFTELEKGIVGKTTTLWEKEEDKLAALAQLLGDDSDYRPKSDIKNIKNFDGIKPIPGPRVFRPEPVPVLEEAEFTPLMVTGKLPEQIPGPQNLTIPFEAGTLEVVFDQEHWPQEKLVQIKLNGKEIGKGSVINGNLDVTLNPELKAGLLFAGDPTAERALKKAIPVINQYIKALAL